MAPTSDERREVAARLREDASCSESSPRDVVESYLGIEYDGADVLEESYTSESLLHIADLIDPTCKVSSVETYFNELGQLEGWEFHLTCGHSFLRPYKEAPAYCPQCGARVVIGNGE